MISRLVHGARRSFDEWAEIFRCGPDGLRDLIASGALRDEGGRLALRFVGVISREDSAWLSVPALMGRGDQDAEVGELRLVNGLLESYVRAAASRQGRVDEVATHLYTGPAAVAALREIDVFSALFQWTTTYGLHEADLSMRSEDPSARVSWGATFAQCLPVVTSSGLVFHEPIALRERGFLGRIGQMQAFALHDLTKRYSPLADVLAFPFNDLLDLAAAVAMADEAPQGTWSDELLELRHLSNRDHEQELIAILQEYAGCAEARHCSASTLSLFGTVSFELVWEDMCRVTLGGRRRPGARLSNPAYLIAGCELPTAPQRPDILLGTSSGVVVVDAKYYPTFPNSVPQLEDVRKQFFYALSSNEPVSGLAFVLPISADDVQTLGAALMREYSGAVDSRFGSISCIGIPWDKVCRAYLEGATLADVIEAVERFACS